MTSIKDLEMCIEGAEDALAFVKDQLAWLKTHLRELKEKQDKQQEPESLFGRWATHPEYGRGIIVSIKPDPDGEVRFAYRNSRYMDDVDTRFVRPESLDLGPVTLTTTEDFEDAPEGTIAEELEYEQTVFMKHGSHWFPIGDDTEIESGDMPTCRVIRWGNGQ